MSNGFYSVGATVVEITLITADKYHSDFQKALSNRTIEIIITPIKYSFHCLKNRLDA